MATVKWFGGNMSNYGDQFMKCPECGGTAEAECVDVGVGLYIGEEYICDCGYNSAADGRMNVAAYSDWFPELSGNIIQQSEAVFCGYNVRADFIAKGVIGESCIPLAFS